MSATRARGDGISTCANCGRVLGKVAVRCLYCGAVRGRLCPTCRGIAPVNALVCLHCSTAIPPSTPNFILGQPQPTPSSGVSAGAVTASGAITPTGREPVEDTKRPQDLSRRHLLVALVLLVVALIGIGGYALFRGRAQDARWRAESQRITAERERLAEDRQRVQQAKREAETERRRVEEVKRRAAEARRVEQDARAVSALRVPAGFCVVPGAVAEPYTKTGWAKEVMHKRTAIKMVFIPAGQFLMGSPKSEEGHLETEAPQHRVRITRPFYMGKFQIRQGQWQRTMRKTPSHFRRGSWLPVEMVSWEDCQLFLKEAGDGLRLPTEAEWEYACRAGTTTRFHSGDADRELDVVGWHRRNSGGRTHWVGQKSPNAWGLYDMHGNVWEWCADWYDAVYYARRAGVDPTGPVHGKARVLRGGSWGNKLPVQCRSASRFAVLPKNSYDNIGFRPALRLSDPPVSRPSGSGGQKLAALTISGKGYRLRVFRNGVHSLSNRPYVWQSIPTRLEDFWFTQREGGKHSNISIEVRKPGTVFLAIGAEDERQRNIKSGQMIRWLEKDGWKQTPMTFHSYRRSDGAKTKMAVMSKSLPAGAKEVIPSLSPWTGPIVIFPKGK